ncbi:signal transduction histidine kinase [Cystobacter fuscus]|uniref:histidine kinase n=1 Tax=Cystobacter fuscus TaxID=43 RepID=A0A250J3X9_9BACT|nr:ATP-binding protein [Cystobacter fuscus]ATB38208.1 signal transduction histidine kinase [Cystobacter fuscus]
MKTMLAARRVRSRVFFVSAAIILVTMLARCALSGFVWTAVEATVRVQLSWIASFVLLGVGVGSGHMKSGTPGLLSGLVCLVCMTQLTLLTGGTESPYLVTLVSVPLLVSMFTPNARLPTLVSLVAMMGAILLINHFAGIPPRGFLPQMLSYGAIGSIGLYAGRSYRKLRQAEQLAQEERLQALERLAESERLRRHAESERADMERLMMVGQLAAGVAHEVNNPLAFVKSNLHYLQHALTSTDRPTDVEELHELLDETRQGVLRIQRIITELRQYSHPMGAPEQEGSPRQAMEEARRLALSRLHSRSEVVLDLSEELPNVRLGQRHLMQVLLNLLLHAAQTLEEAEPERPARILLKAWRTARDVQVVVEDDGPGIPQDVLPRLFDPFFSPPYSTRGVGLGLALCREYVLRVGGTLSVENRPEGGTRFILTLNQSSAPPSPSQET